MSCPCGEVFAHQNDSAFLAVLLQYLQHVVAKKW
jgi:hypothetical protein